MCTHFTPTSPAWQVPSAVKPCGVFNILPRLVKELVHGGQQRLGDTNNRGGFTVRAATICFGLGCCLLFQMRCFVLDCGHGCYKRGYDALKLARTEHLSGRRCADCVSCTDCGLSVQRPIKCSGQIDVNHAMTAIQATLLFATANHPIEAINWSAEMVVEGVKSSPCVDAINDFFDVMRCYFLH